MFRRNQLKSNKENRFFRKSREHRYPVEVPASPREILLRRRALTLTVLKWGALAGFTGGILYYAADIWGHAFRSGGAWSVGQIDYRTNGGIPARIVNSAAGLRPDLNLMDVDMGHVRASLEQLPRVKSVKVERRLPDRLAITLDERLPVTWLTSDRQGLRRTRGGLMLDAEGVAFRCDEVLDSYGLLPAIDDPALPSVKVGQPIQHEPVKAALSLLVEMNTRRWPVPLHFSRVNIRNEWTYDVESDGGATFTFRPEETKAQLAKLDCILEVSIKRDRLVASANLQLQRNIPVRFFDQITESAAPATATATPVSYRKPGSNTVSRPTTKPRSATKPARH